MKWYLEQKNCNIP